MEKVCHNKRCKKVIDGEGYKVKVKKYFGRKELPEEIWEYCSERCYRDDYLNKP